MSKMVLKICSVNESLYLLMKKASVPCISLPPKTKKLILKLTITYWCWKYSGVTVRQSDFKELIELITSEKRNSLIKRLLNFEAVFSNSVRKRYVVEEKLQQSKLKS